MKSNFNVHATFHCIRYMHFKEHSNNLRSFLPSMNQNKSIIIIKNLCAGNVARYFVCSFIIISKLYSKMISQYASSEFRCNYVPFFVDGAWKVFVYVNGGATANFIHWMNLNFLLCFFLVRIWNNTFKKNTYYLAIIFLFRGISKVGFILTKA